MLQTKDLLKMDTKAISKDARHVYIYAQTLCGIQFKEACLLSEGMPDNNDVPWSRHKGC